MKDILITVIVPIFNTHKYLSRCVNSLLKQNINIEIILINDGSTDKSGDIINDYAKKHENIKAIHQENKGLSQTRNKGLQMAIGEYVLFIDSDDWIKPNSLIKLYQKAHESNAEMVMGNIVYCYPNGKKYNPLEVISNEFGKTIMQGSQWYIELMKRKFYYFMACNYMYNRAWLVQQSLQFKDVLHEDELWTPIALCHANKVAIANYTFYYYRQRKGSIMHSLDNKKRIESLFYITNELINFAARYTFDGNNGELKSYFVVDIFRLYSLIFQLVFNLKNSTLTLPRHYLYFFCRIHRKMDPTAKQICLRYYQNAKSNLKNYLHWVNHPSIKNAHQAQLSRKNIILVYNNPVWSNIPYEKIPSNCLITTDRKYFNDAKVIVFHLPDLFFHLEKDLDKPENQIWIAWSMECEAHYSFLKDLEFMDIFDYQMSYHPDSDIPCPYYRHDYISEYQNQFNVRDKTENLCMFISSTFNKSNREEYLLELSKHIPIDSYGRFMNNKHLEEDQGVSTKENVSKSYKFIIAFENAIHKDYVTEKFFEPLKYGVVPIYLGAPNILEFAPGKNCFVDIRDFSTPKDLADFLQKCYNDDSLYSKFQEWRNQALKDDFLSKVQCIEEDHFVRLCKLIYQTRRDGV